MRACVHDASNDGDLAGCMVILGLLLLVLGSGLICSVCYNLACKLSHSGPVGCIKQWDWSANPATDAQRGNTVASCTRDISALTIGVGHLRGLREVGEVGQAAAQQQ